MEMIDSLPNSPNEKSTSKRFTREKSTQLKFWDYIAMTPLGLGSVLIGAWVYSSFGEAEQDYLLYMSGFAFSITALFFVLLAYIERWRLKRELAQQNRLTSVKVEVSQDLLTGFTLPSIPINPLFQIKVQWYKPTAREYHLELFGGRLNELIKPKRRGKVHEVQRQIILEDIFGFTSLRWFEKQACDINVYPQQTPSNELSLRRPQQGDDFYDPIGEPHGDLVEMRRYEDGDPLKLVMWRVFARSRQLVVRSAERALAEKRDLVAYFMAHPSDEASASTARSYLDAGLLGEDFIFIADGCQGQARNASQVMDHLLSSAEGQTGSALAELLALPPQQQRGVIVFASAQTPIEDLLMVITALPSPPLVILSLAWENEALDVEPIQHWWAKLLNSIEKESISPKLDFEDLKQVIQQLRTYQEPMIIAQPSGRQVHLDYFEADL